MLRVILETDVNKPKVGSFGMIVPEKSGGDDFLREDGLVEWVINDDLRKGIGFFPFGIF